MSDGQYEAGGIEVDEDVAARLVAATDRSGSRFGDGVGALLGVQPAEFLRLVGR